jgi:hypothetical protein
MNKVPSISVVMCAYNHGPFIAEAINSIMRQTIQDFEFIIIDDGSTDDTWKVISQFQSRDARIRAITRENKGVVASVNQGIGLAQGAWVARMDADDVCTSDRFEKQLTSLRHTGADICGTWIQLFGTRGNWVKKYPIDHVGIEIEMLFSQPIGNATVFMKTVYAQSLLYDGHYERAEDYDYFERAMAQGWIFSNLDEPLYLYRHHSQQTSTQHYLAQQDKSQEIRLRYWHRIATKYGLLEDEIAEVMKIRDPHPPFLLNMDFINSAFDKILNFHGAHYAPLLLSNMTPLYLMCCNRGREPFAHLKRFFLKWGLTISPMVQAQFMIISLLKINPQSQVFSTLRDLYLRFLMK